MSETNWEVAVGRWALKRARLDETGLDLTTTQAEFDHEPEFQYSSWTSESAYDYVEVTIARETGGYWRYEIVLGGMSLPDLLREIMEASS
jgi:hypothetical protein